MAPLRLVPPPPQGYQWLKEKVQSKDGQHQQAKVKELQPLATRLGCTVAQLAIGEGRANGMLG